MMDMGREGNTVILSVSRRTDIPACYPEWFMHRLRAGFVLARNPMNSRQVSRITLTPETVDCIVFWTKNPAPMLPFLPEIRRMGYPFLFQVTLNAYGREVEASLPALQERLDAFRALSRQCPVVWRYDPILLSDTYTVDWHIARFRELASALEGCTDRCVISFLDVYDKIRARLRTIGARPCTEADMHRLAAAFAEVAGQHGLRLQTCAEKTDLAVYGVGHGACIDADLIGNLLACPVDGRRDANQRGDCGCLPSVDVGAYNTCGNGCLYCYANHSPEVVARSAAAHRPDSPLLTGCLLPDDRVTERAMPTIRRTDGEQTSFLE